MVTDINDKVLDELRKEIDILDNQILEVIEQRFELVKKVAQRKKETGLPIRDIGREEIVINTKVEKSDLPEKFVRNLYRSMIDTAIEMEKEEYKE